MLQNYETPISLEIFMYISQSLGVFIMIYYAMF